MNVWPVGTGAEVGGAIVWVGRGRAHAYVRFTMLQRWEETSKDLINSMPRSIDVHVSGCMQTFGMHCRGNEGEIPAAWEPQ